MSYVSIVQVTVKPGRGDEVERAIEQVLRLRHEWLQSGDLIASRAIRSTDGTEYALVSSWKDQAAHDRHENDAQEQKILAQFASALASPPRELSGPIIGSLGSLSR